MLRRFQAVMIVSAAASTCLAQGRLIAVDSARVMYQVNMATGARTPIGNVSVNAGVTGGLAYDCASQTMYVTSTSNDALYRLDVATGVATLVGPYGDATVTMHGIEWDISTGRLFGVSSHNNGLYFLNTTTGAATLVGTSGLTSFTNLGYHADSDVMYATNALTDSFYTINRATGAATLVGPLVGPTNPNSLAFNFENNLLYMADAGLDNLYTIQPDTGAAALVGSMSPGNILGLAYVPSGGIADATEPVGVGDLTSINVTLSGAKAEIFRIRICNRRTFSATTVGGATIDTTLFLFNAAGMGVVQNDDVPPGNPGEGTPQSLITSEHTIPLTPGIYYLAVSSGRNPSSARCHEPSLMWADTPADTERTPDGPGAGAPLVAWDGVGVDGDVTIFLTGVGYMAQECPPPCDGDVNCDLALDGFDVETQERAIGGDATDYCRVNPDFNFDVALDGFDVEAVELVVGGGPCP